MPIVIDLFAGIGGLSLGAYRAGFTVGAAVDIDPNAINTHTTNFPNTFHIQDDITHLNGNSILQKANITPAELVGIIGGPPCQGFSSIGHGNVNDVRNRLFVKFFEIISELQPLFFVAENVPGIMKEKYNGIREEAFTNVANYTLLPPLSVNASEYGAPTTRTRIFFIGFRNCNGIQPFNVNDFERQKVSSDELTTVKKALEGLPADIRYTSTYNSYKTLNKDYFGNQHHIQSDYFYERVTSCIPKDVGNVEYVSNYQSKKLVNGCIPTKHTSIVRKRFAKVNHNQHDTISRSKRLDPDGFCPTLRAGTGPEKGSYQAVRPIHYKYNRVITPREAARLQGFPDWFKLPDTIWHSFRQIGNSVSPIVAEKIMTVIFQKLTL